MSDPVNLSALATKLSNAVRASLESDDAFLDGIVERVVTKLLTDERLIATIVERSGEAAIAGIANAFTAVPARRARVDAAVAPAKRGKPRKRPRRAATPLTPVQQRVYDAILAGRDTKSTIMKHARVAGGQYRAAVKGLKTRGLLKIEGTRAQAKITVATK